MHLDNVDIGRRSSRRTKVKMYIPPYFKIEDPEAIERIVSENGFATLITPSSEGIKATHLPLLYVPRGSSEDAGIINGHMARANDHWRSIEGQSESLAIFQGPDAYISPEWYETAPAVPTWNFAVVHMRGPLELIDDREWLTSHVDDMVKFHESRALDHPPAPPNPELKASLIGGIVGFRMTVTTIEAKFKLNQNRSDADRQAVADTLDASGDQTDSDVAALMRKHGSS